MTDSLIKDRGVSYVQASQDLGVHTSQLRDWVKKFAEDPEHAFPGQGQMKPEQLEIAQLKREVIKLRAERDILWQQFRIEYKLWPTTGFGYNREMQKSLIEAWLLGIALSWRWHVSERIVCSRMKSQ